MKITFFSFSFYTDFQIVPREEVKRIFLKKKSYLPFFYQPPIDSVDSHQRFPANSRRICNKHFHQMPNHWTKTNYKYSHYFDCPLNPFFLTKCSFSFPRLIGHPTREDHRSREDFVFQFSPEESVPSSLTLAASITQAMQASLSLIHI